MAVYPANQKMEPQIGYSATTLPYKKSMICIRRQHGPSRRKHTLALSKTV